MIAIELVEKRDILIKVGIDVVAREGHVGLHVIRKSNNLKLQALPRKVRLNGVQNLFGGTWSDTHT